MLFRLVTLDFSKSFVTDVTALINIKPTKAETRLALDLLEEKEAYMLYFVFESELEEKIQNEAVENFINKLKGSDYISTAGIGNGLENMQTFAQWQFEHRYDLLFPKWLREKRALNKIRTQDKTFEEWLAQEVIIGIDACLESPDSLLVADLLPQDPLNLTYDLLTKLEYSAPVKQLRLAWATTTHSPLSELGQEPVFEAINKAYEESKQVDVSLKMHFTGIHRYAAESRQKIHNEVVRLNLLSILAVGIVSLTLLKKIIHYWHLSALFIFSTAAALTVTSIVFDKPHILSLVIGSVLVGIVVDYGIHILTHKGSTNTSGYSRTLQEVRLPLLSGAISTVAGFALLTFSELSLLQQIGVYIATAIISAVVFCWLWFPLWKVVPNESKAKVGIKSLKFSQSLIVVLGVLFALITVGAYKITWHDDLRQLDIAHPELDRVQNKISEAFGNNQNAKIYISVGKSPAEARKNLAEWEAYLEQKNLSHVFSLSKILPTQDEWLDAKEFGRNEEFLEVLKSKLVDNEFEETSFAPFFRAWNTWKESPCDYSNLFESMDNRLEGPSGHLCHWDGNTAWLLSRVPNGTEPAITPEGTLPLDNLKSLNSAFSQYRKSLVKYGTWGLLISTVWLCLIWGFKKGLLATLLPLGAIGFALGLFGWMSHVLNLFHLIGLMLGYCLSMDYVLFTLQAHERGDQAPKSVSISALTTITAFGVLCLSSIVALQSLGYTVVFVVLGTMLALFLFVQIPHRE